MASFRSPLGRIAASPLALAAVGVVAIGGVVAGQAIGESKMVMRGIGGDTPIQPSFGIGTYSASRDTAQPDHYPLVTPEGTVPVAELALRGRLRNSHGGWRYDEPDYEPLPEPDYGFPSDPQPEQYTYEEVERLARWQPAPQTRDVAVTVRRGSATPAEEYGEPTASVEYTAEPPRVRQATASRPVQTQPANFDQQEPTPPAPAQPAS